MAKQGETSINKKKSDDVLGHVAELMRIGKLSEASGLLRDFVADKPKGSEAIEAYALLIRISSETREFEKIAEYVEQVKKIRITKDIEKRKSDCCAEPRYNAGSYFSAAPRLRRGLE
jgi:thioredoxin-like negative regulator of GroEL